MFSTNRLGLVRQGWCRLVEDKLAEFWIFVIWNNYPKI